MEGTVSIHPHKGRSVTEFIAYRSRGEAPREPGKGSPPPQTRSEQETESRVAGPVTFRVVKTERTGFSWAQLQVVIL